MRDSEYKCWETTLKPCEWAIGHLRSAQSLNPLQEEIYSLLMTAYAEKGDRPAIRETYRQLKDALKEELGLEPSKSSSKHGCE